MVNLEIDLVNLFMIGEHFSINESGHEYRDTTTIKCDDYTFVFKQYDINLKQNNFLNQTLVTTSVSINNIHEEEIEKVLETIDDICWLLSFTQQSLISRYSYRINNEDSHLINCSGIIVNPSAHIIEPRGKAIRNFIEQVYQTYIQIKNIRQLPVVIGYLCEANRSSLACEISLISCYIVIENLKHTFSIEQGYKYKDSNYSHPLYPPQDYHCENKEEYCFREDLGLWIHKKFGRCRSAEMTKRMFEHAKISRDRIATILKKRNSMIHEGILLPFGDENYNTQALKDLNNVNDLLRKYLLIILGYKGEYILNSDRIGASGVIK